MAEEKKDETSLTLSTQDLDGFEKFIDHFKFTRSKEYIKAVEEFRKNNNPATMREAIYQIAKIMHTIKGKNDLVDDVFSDTFPACDNISYSMQFEKDLEDIIGVDPTTQNRASDS